MIHLRKAQQQWFRGKFSWIFYSLICLALLGVLWGCGKLSDDTSRPSTPVGTSGGSPVNGGPKNVAGTYRLTLTADRNSIPADLTNFSVLSATLSDSSGRSVFGYAVNFLTSGNIGWFYEPTGGQFVPIDESLTDSDGIATTRLYGSQSGEASVTASIDLDLDGVVDLTASKIIALTPAGPPSSAGSYTLTLWANPNTVPADVSTPATIVATVRDASGGPVQNLLIEFTAELGYLSNDINTIGTFTTASGVTNQNGSVSLYYFGQTPGSDVITATTSAISDLVGSLSDTTIIHVTGDNPVAGEPTIELFVFPSDAAITTGDTATIKARVIGSDGAELNGIIVNFSTNLGLISPSEDPTDASGFAATELSSDISGIATVYATVNYVGGSVTEEINVNITEGVEEISVSTPTRSITLGTDGTASETITASAVLKDVEGQFIEGAKVSFNVDTNCSIVTFSPLSFSATTDAGGLALYQITVDATNAGSCPYTVRAASDGSESQASGTINVSTP